jgi:hypothetical protein
MAIGCNRSPILNLVRSGTVVEVRLLAFPFHTNLSPLLDAIPKEILLAVCGTRQRRSLYTITLTILAEDLQIDCS